MYASRFDGSDFDNTKSDGMARKLIDSACSMKLHLHKSDAGKVYMDFTIEGSFGEPAADGDFPEVTNDDAQASARELLAAFLGNS